MGCGTSVSAEPVPPVSSDPTRSAPLEIASTSKNTTEPSSVNVHQSPVVQPSLKAPEQPPAVPTQDKPVVPLKPVTTTPSKQLVDLPRQPLGSSKSEGRLGHDARSPRLALPPIVGGESRGERPSSAPHRGLPTASSTLEMRKPSLPPILKRHNSLDDMRGGGKGILRRRNSLTDFSTKPAPLDLPRKPKTAPVKMKPPPVAVTAPDVPLDPIDELSLSLNRMDQPVLPPAPRTTKLSDSALDPADDALLSELLQKPADTTPGIAAE